MGDRGKEDLWQGGGWRTGWFHICVWINWEEQLGSKTNCATQGSYTGKESLKTSVCKNLWVWQWRERLPASQENSLERSTGS